MEIKRAEAVRVSMRWCLAVCWLIRCTILPPSRSLEKSINSSLT